MNWKWRHGRRARHTAYPFAIRRQDGRWQIDPSPLFGAIVEDLRRKVCTETISRRFHNGLVETLVRLACLLRQESSINQICLSGGTFNNLLVFEHLIRKLERHGFEVFTHSEVPTGDGGLSLGQALVAAHSAPTETQISHSRKACDAT